MIASHEMILVAGILCLIATFAGLLSTRVGTPLLLVFIAVVIAAGEDGLGGIVFNNFKEAYLLGSVALATILFQGGLSTERRMVQQAFWPAAALAVVGVAISAAVVATATVLLFKISWIEALLLGAATAPTDAAAVSVLLNVMQIKVPHRVSAVLEVESGLNDPASVFLTVGLIEFLTNPAGLTVSHAALLFLEEMGGGAVIGFVSGYAMLGMFRWLRTQIPVFPVLAVGGCLATFGIAQVVGASGFLAVYLAGAIVGNYEHQAAQPVTRFFGTLAWLAQISLFLMLGLLVTPHELPPIILPALAVSAILILIARPLAVCACLLPFRWRMAEVTFVAWAGLRGAVPIYLTIIPLLNGLRSGHTLFNIVFVVVVVSVAVQGWTAPPAARLMRLEEDC
jgi:potassium/hydrogen antiporter